MEAYLDEFRSAIAALKKRLDMVEALAAEPLAKLKADTAEAAMKAAMDAKVAAKQAEIDALTAEPEPPAGPDHDALVAAHKAKVDALNVELDNIKTEPERQAKIADLQKEIDAARAAPLHRSNPRLSPSRLPPERDFRWSTTP